MHAHRHPLHPALVHFPVACWSLATFADLASLRLGEPAWRLAGMMLAIGTLSALAAMGAGLFEFARIAEGSPALPTLAPGQYKLQVEAAREAGGRELVSIPFEWPAKQAATLSAKGKGELGEVTLELKP